MPPRTIAALARQGKHARVCRRATDRRAILPAMPAKEIAAFLRSTPVFAGVPAPEIDSIASVVSQESHRARACVFLRLTLSAVDGDTARLPSVLDAFPRRD